MSYDIIKKIQIRDNKVYITSACNNVIPRMPREHESSYCNKILQEQGKEALDISILEAYQSGSFQGGTNKYTRALKVLRHMPEYKEFDWRQDDYKLYRHNIETRKPEFEALMLKALKTRLPKEKYILKKDYYDNTTLYLTKHRRNSRSAKWTRNILEATQFNYAQDLENLKKCFTNSENWKVLKAN